MDLLGMHTAVPARLSAAHIGFRDLMANEEEVIVQNRGDLCEAVAVLQYTGGTTGIPKAAMLTHANFFAALNILSRFVGAVSSELKASGDSSTPAAPATKQLSVLPMSHIAGLITGVIAPLLSGIENVLHLRFDVTQALLDIERKRITKLAGNPSIFAAFARHPAFGHTDLSSVSLWTYGSAPMPAEVASAFAERVAQSCIQGNGYGLTETTGAGTTHIFANGTSRTGTVGLPLPLTTVEIVDLETGTTVLPVGQPGEICFSGPTVMMGYWNNPEATKIAMRGGRFHTGDIGMTDENGYLTLLDRKKDVILVGGRNVYPTRVEHAIFELPSVAETAVIGVPHEYFGEVAKAFVVLKAGYPEFTLNSLQVFLSDKLSRHEFPLELEFRASLPKTSVGKVLKKDLHAEMVTRGTVNPEG
jgi:long-chain acyl-CoA synthetase